MSKAELARVSFGSARIAGVNFTQSNLSRAQLGGLVFQGNNLTGSLSLPHPFRRQRSVPGDRPEAGADRGGVRQCADGPAVRVVRAEGVALQLGRRVRRPLRARDRAHEEGVAGCDP